MDNELPIYIGRWPDCGCVTAACVDEPRHKKDTAKFLKEIVSSGRIIERVEAKDWHTVKLQRCKHRNPKTGKLYGNPEVAMELLNTCKK